MSETLLLLSFVIMLESEGESYSAKWAVASTIWNRSNHSLDSMMDVARDGYSGYKARAEDMDWMIEKWKKESPKNWDDCMFLAKRMTDGSFHAMGTMTHFFNPDMGSPYWEKDMINKKQIDKQVFGNMRSGK